ncbi:hypothetical protein B296_00039661 [Ensete ventricosum]|uniref:CRIB domain-containing protein n=1 Tax=Ensete ventricosum TaxID=4639 RepID=A0A426ZST4_ENSVE|nr:hypothetical protein B296_00039661 [Ensete ventricosum]
MAALRKSLVMCSVACGQRGASPASMEIGWPTDVRHLAHVTFDRFDGFLGLPAELEPEVPPRVPSASQPGGLILEGRTSIEFEEGRSPTVISYPR